MSTTGDRYSTLTVLDALPDGASFEIRYLNLTGDSIGASLYADAMSTTERTNERKARYLRTLDLDPDGAPVSDARIFHSADDECPHGDTHAYADCGKARYNQERRWLAHWRDELARLNGTDSDTAKAIIREAIDAWDCPAGLSRFVWALA